MTTQELRELDAWIAEHVMGWKRVDSVLRIFSKDQFATNSAFNEPPRVMIYESYSSVQSWIPTERGSDAMDVLKKCAEKHQHDIAIGTAGPTDWRVWAGELNGATYASSLELAICLFAKQLFSKPTTK